MNARELVPRLLKIEARQRDEHESGKAKNNDGTYSPLAIIMLFHIGTSFGRANACARGTFRGCT